MKLRAALAKRANAWLLLAAATGWATMGIVLGFGLSHADTPGTTLCTNNPCVIQAANAGNGDNYDGLVVHAAAGLNHAWAVTDQNNAFIIWTNPDSFNGGDIRLCATSTDLSDRACIVPGTWNAAAGQYQGGGTVQLWQTSTGPPAILTYSNIKYLQRLQAA